MFIIGFITAAKTNGIVYSLVLPVGSENCVANTPPTDINITITLLIIIYGIITLKLSPKNTGTKSLDITIKDVVINIDKIKENFNDLLK